VALAPGILECLPWQTSQLRERSGQLFCSGAIIFAPVATCSHVKLSLRPGATHAAHTCLHAGTAARCQCSRWTASSRILRS
jgi:hypothetical protein